MVLTALPVFNSSCDISPAGALLMVLFQNWNSSGNNSALHKFLVFLFAGSFRRGNQLQLCRFLCCRFKGTLPGAKEIRRAPGIGSNVFLNRDGKWWFGATRRADEKRAERGVAR